MVEVTGKTINDLAPVTGRISKDFKFLGCLGSSTQYSTVSTTYANLSADLSAVFMESLGSDIDRRLTDIENAINTGDGTLYFRKNTDVDQVVTARSRFKNRVDFDGSASFQLGTVTIPKDTFMNPSGNSSAAFEHSDNTRVAVRKDITDAVARFAERMAPTSEQILDVGYSAYRDNGVNITPFYTNKKYQFEPGSETHNFYRYAGIKTSITQALDDEARKDGVVYKQVSGKYFGVPLTKSYRTFKDITVIYLLDSSPTSNVGGAKNIGSYTVSTFELDMARRYAEYKRMYMATDEEARYFDGVKDKWYIGDSSGALYLDIRTDAVFTDLFVPLMFSTNGYCVVAVFGRN